MWCDVSHVQEIGLLTLNSLFQEPNCEIVESVGHVEILRQFPTLAVKTVRVLIDFVKVADLGLAHRTEEPIKPAVQRRVSSLPLANHLSLVACLLKHLAKRDALAKVLWVIPAISAVVYLLTVEAR